MKFIFTDKALNELISLEKQNLKLFRKIQKQLKIFRHNHKHPSLRTHKLKGGLSNSWSISIEGNFRILFFLKEEKAVFYKFGTHDEVYKSN
ncbi:MAG: type II toxin-antitoxin system YoeB family toxin [Candidatus Daviesbacteria bacterium]|nr:type II toxin-antitoxin system YoeB family toxin [Candidatus Daviesbacteria bacterium]